MKAIEQEIERLGDQVAYMGGLVEQSIRDAIQALVDRDAVLARGVVAADEAIDQAELRMDAHAERIIALRQPVAGDLRHVFAAIKIAPALERMGDHATSIAERVQDLLRLPEPAELFAVPRMGEIAAAMVHLALDAYSSQDAAAARRAIAQDDQLDDLLRETFVRAETAMSRDPSRVPSTLRMLMISKNLERIGDQVTNICEFMIYAWEARNLRHAPREEDDEPLDRAYPE